MNLKSSGATINSSVYKYDKTTNRREVVLASGDRVTWTYDPTYQLAREKRGPGNAYDLSYLYDAVGNRLEKVDNLAGTITTSVYNSANRLVYSKDASGRTTFTYNAAGMLRIEQKPTGERTTSVWGYEAEPRYIDQPTSRVTFTYNGDIQRVAKQTSADTRRYVYDGNNMFTETDGSNAQRAVYTFEPQVYGNLVSQLWWNTITFVPAFFHFDGLGNTINISDSAANSTDGYQYYAFGETLLVGSHPTTTPYTWIGEQGYIRDQETNEYQLHVRQYQPDKARFKSEDPLGLEPDINQYRYAYNNSTNLTDPSGNEIAFTGPDRADDADRFEAELERCGIRQHVTRRYETASSIWFQLKATKGTSNFELCKLFNLAGNGGCSAIRQEIMLSMLQTGFQFKFANYDAFLFQIAARENIVGYASGSNLKVGEGYRNPDVWREDPDGYYYLRPGKDLGIALYRLLENRGGLYECSCTRSFEVIYLAGIQKTLLDMGRHDLALAVQRASQNRAILGGEFKKIFTEKYGSEERPLGKSFYVPGDHVYFDNPDTEETDLLSGSNTIYVGCGKFRGVQGFFTLEEKVRDVMGYTPPTDPESRQGRGKRFRAYQLKGGCHPELRRTPKLPDINALLGSQP